MRKVLFILMALLSLGSCAEEPEKTENSDDTPSKDIFYVRYCCDDPGAGGTYMVKYTKEDGTKTTLNNIRIEGLFERTVGPVDKGFISALTIVSNSNNNLTIIGRIEVKKNDAPFVVKTEGSCNGSISYILE